jgi:shikimate kinase
MLVALVGFRGSGKSTVGRLLAERLGCSFLDMDSEIERREGRTVAGIFEKDGEPAFRRLEGDLAAELANRDGLVVATGGGVVANPAAVGALLEKAVVVYMEAPAAVLAERIKMDNRSAALRPSLTNADSLEEEVANLLDARAALYQAFSDVTIAVGEKSPDSLATEIEEFIRNIP